MKEIVILIVCFLLFLGIFYILGHEDIERQIAYGNFCKERTDFCTCNLLGCTFVTSTLTLDLEGNIRNTNMEELCSLAEKLNDREMLEMWYC
jgi:hypothetical protein